MKKILVVEDNPGDLLLIQEAFSASSFMNQICLSHAGDGEEALSSIESLIPELILLDINIPRINGLEVLQKIKSNPNTKHTPVIILSTSDNQRDISKAYEYGAASYLNKTLDLDVLFKQVEIFTQYWIGMNKFVEL